MTSNVLGSHVLRSQVDRSINFVRPTEDGGSFEARYVRCADDYIVVYLSSHSGCRQACKFCHLTATRQTMMAPASIEDFLAQADDVFAHYDLVKDSEGHAQRVHFNWMARGEALANDVLMDRFSELTDELAKRAGERELTPIFNVSTIMPRGFEDRDLATVLSSTSGEVVLYYSLYSLNPSFRRNWLPTAMPADEALQRIADYQQATARRIVLHWAYIEDENDSHDDAVAIADAIARYGLNGKFNLVRYNPYDASFGQESSEQRLEENFAVIAAAFDNPESRIIPRVGFDVKASCGMFVEKGK